MLETVNQIKRQSHMNSTPEILHPALLVQVLNLAQIKVRHLTIVNHCNMTTKLHNGLD